MRITILGATGNLGRRTLTEATDRGHEVTAVVRDHTRLDALPRGVAGTTADAMDPTDVRRVAKGQDAVVTAARPPAGREPELAELTGAVIEGVDGTGARLLVVGGAASLTVPDTGRRLLDDPRYVDESYLAIAAACVDQLEVCRDAPPQLDWTYLSPPARIAPGERTGRYRLGRDELVVDDQGRSQLSMEDVAVAVVDELERPQHRRIRFTVGA